MIYDATIRVRVDENDRETAHQVAAGIAGSINDESLTDSAVVVNLVARAELDAEVILNSLAVIEEWEGKDRDQVLAATQRIRDSLGLLA